MKKVRLFGFSKIVMTLAAVCAMSLSFVRAQTPDGSSANPYPIRTADQLISLAQRVNAGGEFYFNPSDSTYATTGDNAYKIPAKAQEKYFKLVADIDLNPGKDVASCDGDGTGLTAWTPMGTVSNPFDGILDGDFHLIIGAYVSQSTANAGLFGCTSNHTIIQKLGVVNSYVAGSQNIGGLVGQATGSKIEKSFFAGTVSGTTRVGGLAGSLSAGTEINTCYTTATVSADNQVGGVAGFVDVSSTQNQFINCYSASVVRGKYQYTGGFVGEDKNVNTMYSSSIYDKQLIDLKGYSPYRPNVLVSENSTRDMTSISFPIGGFTNSGGYYPYITGFHPESNALVFFSMVPFFLPEGTTLSDISEVSSITLGDLGAGGTWSIDVVGKTSLSGNTLAIDGQSYVVLKAEKDGYSRVYPLQFDKLPYLGEATNPFPVRDVDDLTALRDGVNSGAVFNYGHFTVPALAEGIWFVQQDDIPMPNSNWKSIGLEKNTPFKGYYDGGGHKVSGWKFDSLASAGFFRYTENATIQNLTIANVCSEVLAALIYSMRGGIVDNCHTEGSTVIRGGLIFETSENGGTCYIRNCSNKSNFNTIYRNPDESRGGSTGGILRQAGSPVVYIDNCHNYGNIYIGYKWGDFRVGGIMGRRKVDTQGDVYITNCSNSGNLRGTGERSNSSDEYVGGIVGAGATSVSNCFNTGNITSAGYAGGITGAGNTVSYSYNLGTIKTTDNESSATASGISNGGAVSYSFNAGKVVNLGYGSAYGISSATTVANCFNAGDVRSTISTSYSFGNHTNNKSTRYSIGRLSGSYSTVGGCYFDETRLPNYRTQGEGIKKNTTGMLGSDLAFSTADWENTDDVYPRIKGLDTLTISKVLALPLLFKGTDNVDHVTDTVTVRSKWDIEWKVEGAYKDSNLLIGTLNTDYKLKMPADKTKGNIILAAYKDDSCYYRITLVIGVEAPAGVLTVTNEADLKTLRNGVNSGSAFNYKGTAVPALAEGVTFQMTRDITITETNWTSIGNGSDVPFKGVFDGHNDTIYNLKQTNSSVLGLFGFVDKGVVKNVNLKGASMYGNVDCGGICTYLKDGKVLNCSAAGVLSAGYSAGGGRWRGIGGIVGFVIGTDTIVSCTNYMKVSPYSSYSSYCYTFAGGIVGFARDTTTLIDSCVNAGNVSGTKVFAGISGGSGKVLRCANYGKLEGTKNTERIAGIVCSGNVSSAYGTLPAAVVNSCVNSGEISVPTLSGSCYIAGIAIGPKKVSNCYNVGQLKGKNAAKVAGVVIGQKAIACYNAGQLSGTGTLYAVCDNSETTKSYYDKQMCTATAGYGTGKTTAQMCALTADDLSDEFVFESNMYPQVKGIKNAKDSVISFTTAAPVFLTGSETVAMLEHGFTMGGCVNHGVEWSSNTPNLVVTGCSAAIPTPSISELYAKKGGVTYKTIPLQVNMDAFVIKDKIQLDTFRTCINAGTVFYYNPADSSYHKSHSSGYITVPACGKEAEFRLSADIDLENMTWTPIGNDTYTFQGIFDGGGFSVRNFSLTNQHYSGLFGYVSTTTIKNVVVENVTANSTKKYIGALCGRSSQTTIKNVRVSNVSIETSSDYAGCLCGYANSTTFDNDTSEYSTVKGDKLVGGIVGYLGGVKIENSFVRNCDVTSTNAATKVGGVVGYVEQDGVGASLKNIIVENTNVTGSLTGSTYIGGVVGSHQYGNGGTMQNCHVRGGSVTGRVAGGLCGYVGGLNVYYCSNSASVKGVNSVGGIVGSKDYHDLTYCVNTGSVEGEDYVGGILGYQSAHSTQSQALYGSVNTGTVKGTNYVGGIAGYTHYNSGYAAVSCINLGEVSGEQYVGGIVGKSQGTTYRNMNAGRVSGQRFVGGIVGTQMLQAGYPARSTSNSVSVGQVLGSETVGNVAGAYDEGTLTNCYYDQQMSPNYKGIGSTDADAAGVAVGKLTREMLGTEISISGFTTEAGLYPRPIDLKDSVAAIVAATPVVLADTVNAYSIPGLENYTITPATANDVTWTKDAGETFRVDGSSFKVNRTGRALLTATRDGYAKSLEFVVGVSSDMPCEIKDLAQLANFTNFINAGAPFIYNSESKTFKASGDAFEDVKIAAGGEGSFFKLTFDPNFETESWTGRIGTAAQPFLGDFNGDGHTVNSLRTANHDTCGFFGYNAGTVHDLSFTNTDMESNSYNVVGAVCGYNTGKITNCHLVGGTVAGAENVGAIAGKNNGWITNCHNSATVSGTSYTGGIAGANSKSITFCFNIGTLNGTSYLGGITGNNTNVLSNCYNSGRIKATGTSDYVGGVAGNTGNNISFCYNAGQVTTENTTAHLGAVAGACSSTAISTLAYDEQVCYTMSAFDGGDYSASRLIASAMTGNGLKSLLGEENWIYADSMYPRLKGMDTLDAAYVSATPIFMPGGDHTQSVEHNFKVYANHNGVSWTFANNENNTLDISNLPDVRVNRCGEPLLKVRKMVEEREINLYINYTAVEDVYDTTCGEPKVWALNGVQYTTDYVDVLNVIENGCPVTYTYHIRIPTTMTVAVDSVPQQCVGTASGSATATVTDGFGNYKYEWRDESDNVVGNTYTLGSLNPGRYFLTVTDTLNAKTCVLRDTTTIKEAVPLSFTVDTVSPGCYNVTDGFFQVTMLGGAPSYTLEWSGAASGSRDIAASTDHYEVNGLPSGSYTLTLTDSHSCTATASATLTQNNDAYVITAYSNEKTYDGVTLSANTYTFQTGSTTETRTSGVAYDMGNGDMLTVVVSRGDLTDAGVYANEITSCVVMRGTSDVTCQYNITTNNGNVTIHKRPVTLTSGSTEVNWYEGMAPITNHEMTVGGDGFATGETVTYNFTASLDHGGSIPNAFTINWGAVNRENYDTNKVFGTLTVIQNGVLTVNVIDLVTTYDGDEHTITESAAYTVYGLGDGQTAEVTLSETFPYTYKDADTVEVNIVSVVVKNSLNQDITSTFTTKNYQNGKIQVNPIEITLYSSGYTGVYDGEVHSQPEVFKVGNFIAADVNTPAVSANETIQNAGEKANTITINKTASYKDRNYHVTMTEGVLKVTKRPLYLTGVNTTIPYDGLPHTITEFTHSNLVAGHALVANSVTFSATGTDMDEYTGSFSGTAEVRDFSNNDVSGNYQEMRTPGVLKIVGTAKELRISSSSKEEYYSGTAVKAHTYQVRFGGEAAEMINDTLFRITNDTVKIIVTDPAVIAGQKDAGTLRNSFGYTILPAAHADAYDNVVCDTGSIVVKPRPITFRSASFSRNYNATDIVSDSVEVVGMGFVEGEGATYTYQHGAAGSRTNMGTYKNSFDYSFISGTLASNYIVTLDTGLLQVNPALVTIKTTVNNNDAGPRTRYYGNANDFSYTVDGLQGGEIASDVITGLDAMTYTNVDQYANVGPYRVAANILSLGSVNDNYTFTADTVTLTVVKRPMTVHAVSQSVEYDGQLHNTAVTTVTQYEGLVTGDDVTAITFSLPAAIYIGSSQMEVQTITIMRDANDVSGNYSYTTADTSILTITKKALTITVTGSSKPYDGTALEANTTTCSYTCDGLVAGDEIEVSSIVYEGSQTEVGSSEATLKSDESYLRILHGTTNVKSTAYEVTIVPGTLTVTKSDALVITLPTERTITYDGTTSLSAASTATAPYGTATPVVTYSTDGGATFVSEAPNYTTAGTYTVNVRATCTNYNAVDSILTLTINRAPVTVTADDKTKKFGADEPELTWTPTGLQNSEPATILTVSISRVEGESIGTYAITPSGEAIQGNYNVTYVPGTFTIVRDTVTVTAANKTKVYGGYDPALTATVDNPAVDHLISRSLQREDGEAVGDYTISVSGAVEQGNYYVKFENGTFTITPATATITADAKTKVYGEDDPALTAQISGLQNGDAATVITYTLTRDAGNDVGKYGIHATYEAAQGNYTVTYVDDSLTITPATATVTAVAKTKVYGDDDPELTATVTPSAAESAITYTLSRSAGENIGAYTITPTGAAEQGNYTVTYQTNTFTITQASATVTANDVTKSYGEADPTPLTVTITGLKRGDANSVIAYDIARVPGDTVGTYAITPTGSADQGNYTVTYVPGTLTINRATVTLKADAKTKVYGASDPALTASLTGLTNGDDESVITYTLTRDAGNDVGKYGIHATYEAEQGNYTVTYVDDSLTITPATATITADPKTKVYGEEDPALTAQVSGMQNGDAATVITYTLTRDAGNDVGKYGIHATYEAAQGNYTVTYVDDSLTITPAAATVTAVAKTKVYGNDDPELTATVTPSAAESAITYTLSRSAGENIGTYTITPTGAAEQGNYTVTYQTNTFTITQAPVTVKANDVTKNYGEADPTPLPVTITGLKRGDANSVIAYDIARVPGDTVGTYTITPTGSADQGNYTVTYETGTMTIEKINAVVTIVGNNSTVSYNGTAQSVTGYNATANTALYNVNTDITFTGSATASGTNAGTYNMSLTADQFANTNRNFNTVTFEVTDGYLTISPIDATVTIVGKTNTANYDGTEHKVYGYTATATPTLYNVGSDFTHVGDSVAAGTDAGTYYMNLTSGQFTNTNTNFATVTFNVTDGYQVISPITAAVTIVGNTNTTMYDGTAHTVKGYTATSNTTLYDVSSSFTFSGDSVATRTDVGTTNMGLAASQFVNTNTNFSSVSFTVTDGYQTITKRTGVIVTITGHYGEFVYTEAIHEVSGYDVSINDPLYHESDFTFSGNALIQNAGSENVKTTLTMGLSAGHFANINTNFDNVQFNITDGKMVIWPRMKVSLTSTPISCNAANGANNDGTITATVTGGKPNLGQYMYQLNSGAAASADADSTFTALTAGEYTVTVTDSLGTVVTTDAITLAEPAAMTAAITVPASGSCPNQGTYAVSVAATSDNTPLSYAWSGDAANVDDASTTVAQAGTTDCGTTYTVTVTVTDDKGCKKTVNETFTVVDAEKPTFTAPADTILCRVSGAISANPSVAGEVAQSDIADNCTSAGDFTISWFDADTTGTDADVRVITRKWVAKDLCGNADTVIQTIRIIPSIMTSGNVTYTEPTPIEVTMKYGVLDTLIEVSFDWTNNMTGNTVVVDSTGVPYGHRYTADHGPYTITWTLTDDCGEEIVVTQTVTVNYPPCGGTFKTNADGDGIEYATIQVGSNCWMAENSRTTKYADGTPVTPAPMTYGTPVETFGYLYTYYAATKTTPPTRSTRAAVADGQGICPEGWHIPDDEDFADMMSHFDNAEDLMSTDHWLNPGTNASGYGLEPAGVYNAELDRYEYLYVQTYLWSYEPGSVVFHACQFGSMCGTIEVIPASGFNGFSVRCVHNTED